MIPDDLLTLREVAKLIPGRRPGTRISIDVLRRKCRDGEIPYVVMGRRFLIRKADLHLLFEQGRTHPTATRTMRTSKEVEEGLREFGMM